MELNARRPDVVVAILSRLSRAVIVRVATPQPRLIIVATDRVAFVKKCTADSSVRILSVFYIFTPHATKKYLELEWKYLERGLLSQPTFRYRFNWQEMRRSGYKLSRLPSAFRRKVQMHTHLIGIHPRPRRNNISSTVFMIHETSICTRITGVFRDFATLRARIGARIRSGRKDYRRACKMPQAEENNGATFR